MSNVDRKYLVQVKDLSKHFPVRGGFWGKAINQIKALSNINLNIEAGDVIGVVGESGCGKSTLGKIILRLIEPTSGHVFYKDKDIFSIPSSEMRLLRQKLQIVFQNPYSSLSPKMRIGEIISEPLFIHKIVNDKKSAKEKVEYLLDLVGLEKDFSQKYPHQLSGGQRQRVAIARAISLNPEFLVLDEPVSALDVSVQAQILNLLIDLQKNLNLTYLFISHNLSVISYISTKIIVMYLGHIVEMGTREEIMNSPKHPYTRALLSAAPKIRNQKTEDRIILHGDIPDPSNPPSGCVFRTRCPVVKELCALEEPKLELRENRVFACHFPNK